MVASPVSNFNRAVLATATIFCWHGLAAGQPAISPGENSAALTLEAWSAFERQDYPAARAAIERCQSFYSAQAVEMQGKLATLPETENGHQAWALNDVGTCTFLLGKVAEAEGKKDEAMTSYQKVVEAYPYAQCWDKSGWFWQPAVASRERLAFLSLETE